MKDERVMGRRDFLKTAALGSTLAAPSFAATNTRTRCVAAPDASVDSYCATSAIEFPRTFKGRQLAEIAFPLGGIGTGSISLGGCGQLRDWEIFNRPDKGNTPAIALPALFVQPEGERPVTKVLEARPLPPFNGGRFWNDSVSAIGLPRFASAIFRGSFPFARIGLSDPEIPLEVELEAFSPFIPLDADASGFPVAILRYRLRNPRNSATRISLAYSVENPLYERVNGEPDALNAGRFNESRQGAGLQGMLMRHGTLEASHPLAGSFALSALDDGSATASSLRGWNADFWWSAPLHFWDQFSKDGQLGVEPAKLNKTATLALSRAIPPRATAEFTFLLTWHFPNRTPERCGWNWLDLFFPPSLKPTLQEMSKSIIGNHYCTRFADAWAVAEYVAAHLPELERRTRGFESTLRASTLHPAVLDAATANLSTLVTNTCFRSADGAFHGFEGSLDTAGSCSGNCTHVWNYEATLPFLFPELSRSLREIAFGFSTDERGLMAHREVLPPGKIRLPLAAADGQMGTLIKLYLDWRQSGDIAWLRQHWPAAKRALEFAWIAGGWDADRDGVMEGAQLNTYDVEFYGPNPLMGGLYLGALRAGSRWPPLQGILLPHVSIAIFLRAAAAGSMLTCSTGNSMGNRSVVFPSIKSPPV